MEGKVLIYSFLFIIAFVQFSHGFSSEISRSYSNSAGNGREPKSKELETQRLRVAVSQLVRALNLPEPKKMTEEKGNEAENRTGREFIFKTSKDLLTQRSARQLSVPAPIVVSSQTLRITTGPSDNSGGRSKHGRSIKTVDVQGVPLIVGVRVPDSPEDKYQTWRNARVYKGKLISNNVPEPQVASTVNREVSFSPDDSTPTKIFRPSSPASQFSSGGGGGGILNRIDGDESDKPSLIVHKSSFGNGKGNYDGYYYKSPFQEKKWEEYDKTARLFSEYLLRIFG